MTAWQEPNGRLPFVDGIGNKILATHLNPMVANQRLAYESNVGNWGTPFAPVSIGVGKSFVDMPAFWDGSALWGAYTAASARGLAVVYPNGTNLFFELTGSISVTGNASVCRVPSTGVFEWFPWASSDNYFTVAQDNGWPTGTASPVSYGTAAMRATGPAILTKIGTDDSRVVPAGNLIDVNTKLAVLHAIGGAAWSATIDTGSDVMPTGGGATAGASNNAGIVIVAGAHRMARSTDYGATWTFSNTPTATGLGTTSGVGLGFDATRNVFVMTKLVAATGFVAWTTSSDGSTWQAWRSVNMQALTTPWIGIIDGVWAVMVARPYLGDKAPALSMALSYDAGASWFFIEAGSRPFDTDISTGVTGAAVACGTRFAISNRYLMQFSGAVTSFPMSSSSAYP